MVFEINKFNVYQNERDIREIFNRAIYYSDELG